MKGCFNTVSYCCFVSIVLLLCSGPFNRVVLAGNVFAQSATWKPNRISPHAPFYDTTVGTQRICGGIAIYQANIDTTGFSEDGMNNDEEGPANHGRRNWCLHHETLEVFSPFRMCEVLVWQKSDFMNRGDADGVVYVGSDDSKVYAIEGKGIHLPTAATKKQTDT